MKKYGICFMLALLAICLLTGCQTVFDGSRTGNSDQFFIEYKVLNKTDTQLLDLVEGDVLEVDVVSKSGTVDIHVTGNNGEIYSGKDVPTSTFQLEITENGGYSCSVTGRSAKGSVRFVKITDE